MKKTVGYFIALEGIEGVGKSTMMSFVQQLLTQYDTDFTCLREPGGTPMAEKIREILLQDHEESMAPVTELLLMFACRSQNISHFIKPALQKGQWVLADRFVDASYAYQGGGRELPSAAVDAVADLMMEGVEPDCVLLFDAPVSVGFERLAQRGKKDRIEQESLAFFERVRQAYLTRAQQYPQRYHVIDATQSVEQVQQQVSAVLLPILNETVL